VKHVFGVPGSALVDVWEAARRTPQMRIIASTSELMSSFAANGYARASGKPAVLCTIAGPGLAFAVSGIAEALLDSVPLVFIVDAGSGVRADGAPGLQSIKQVDVMRPLVKCVLEVSSPDEVARATRTALGQASAGEPGPVLLQLTSQALSGAGSSPEPETASPLHEPDTGAIAERLLAARRPLLLVGQGAADAAPEVRRLAEWLRSPVIATTSGRGVVSERHPLCIASDVAGGPAAPLNDLVARADLVLALGCKLSHNGSRGYTLVLPAERLVRVDASREVLGLAYPSSEAVEADVGVFLTSVRRQTDGRAPASEWTDNEIASWRTRNAAQRPARFNPQLGPGPASELFAALRRHLPDRAVVASDSGLHQYVVRANFPVVEPRTLLVPTDFQSMGYGVPAAIGGSIATGERAVAVTGDGGFNIVGLELVTAVRERIPLTVLVLVDGYLGLIRLSQLARTGVETGVDVTTPRLETFASSIGAAYARLDGSIDTDSVLQTALESDEVTIVEVSMRDAPGVGRLRARGQAVSRVRGTVGDQVLQSVRRVVGRA
jgi:acetolactate synthase I/II/III large subunit